MCCECNVGDLVDVLSEIVDGLKDVGSGFEVM
jgi:hypothetical protein